MVATEVKKVTVRVVDPIGSKELKSKNFQLVDNRLRVQQIQDYFKIKHIEWQEQDVILSIRGDGLSDMEFEGGEIITLITDEPLSDSVLNSSISGGSDQDEATSPDEAEEALAYRKPRTATMPTTLSPHPSSSPTRRGYANTIHTTHMSPIPTKPATSPVHISAHSKLSTSPVSIPTTKRATSPVHTSAQNKLSTSPPTAKPATSPVHKLTQNKLSTSPPTAKPATSPVHISAQNKLSTSPMKAFNPHNRLKSEDSFNHRNSSVFVGELKLPSTPTEVGVPNEFDFKLIIVGDMGCGKTSLIRRYVDGAFSKGYKATIGVDFHQKKFIISDNLNVRLQLWDVAGQARFEAFTRVYYQGAVAGMVVFDLTRVKTSVAAAKWKEDIDFKVQQANGEPIPVILVGNKSDLTKEIAVEHTPSYLDKMVADHKFAGWFCTSCQEDSNVKEAFQFLGTKILENDLKFPTLKEEEKDAIKLNMSQKSGKEASRRSCCSN